MRIASDEPATHPPTYEASVPCQTVPMTSSVVEPSRSTFTLAAQRGGTLLTGCRRPLDLVVRSWMFRADHACGNAIPAMQEEAVALVAGLMFAAKQKA